MNQQDYLMTFAQIAGVLVGFANLATVLDSSKIDEAQWSKSKERILIITEGGLTMIGACFLPSLIYFFVQNDGQSFRIASSIELLVYIISSLFIAYRYEKRAGKYDLIQKMIASFCVVFGWTPLAIAAFASLTSNQVIAVYSLAIFQMFIVISIVFVMLFRSIVK